MLHWGLDFFIFLYIFTYYYKFVGAFLYVFYFFYLKLIANKRGAPAAPPIHYPINCTSKKSKKKKYKNVPRNMWKYAKIYKNPSLSATWPLSFYLRNSFLQQYVPLLGSAYFCKGSLWQKPSFYSDRSCGILCMYYIYYIIYIVSIIYIYILFYIIYMYHT